jgi:regulator of protease activity HflC (stomatin/prohibitin superfamily)
MIGTILFLAFVFVVASMILKVIPEYERAIVFRLGRVLATPKGPGLILLIPGVDRMIRVSTRTVTMNIDPQDIITRDNVSVKVNAVLYFRVTQPLRSILNVENYLYATSQLAQTHLRSVLGEHSFDELLRERDRINSKLETILDQNTEAWGIKVESVEIKDVDLPVDMQRAMAKEAEAERERRAKIIAAEGELQAAEKIREAADKMVANPAAIQLRYLQTLSNMSSERSTMIVFPIPVDIFRNLSSK